MNRILSIGIIFMLIGMASASSYTIQPTERLFFSNNNGNVVLSSISGNFIWAVNLSTGGTMGNATIISPALPPANIVQPANNIGIVDMQYSQIYTINGNTVGSLVAPPSDAPAFTTITIVNGEQNQLVNNVLIIAPPAASNTITLTPRPVQQTGNRNLLPNVSVQWIVNASPNFRHQTLNITIGEGQINENNVTINPPPYIFANFSVNSSSTKQHDIFSSIPGIRFNVTVNGTKVINANSIFLGFNGTYKTNSTCIVEICNISVFAPNNAVVSDYGYNGFNKTIFLGTGENVTYNSNGIHINVTVGGSVVFNTILPGVYFKAIAPSLTNITKNNTLIESLLNAEVANGCIPGDNITLPDIQTGGSFTMCTQEKGSSGPDAFQIYSSYALATNNINEGFGQAWYQSLADANHTAAGYYHDWQSQINITVQDQEKARLDNQTLWGPILPNSIGYAYSGPLNINDLVVTLNDTQVQSHAKQAAFSGGLEVAILLIAIGVGAFLIWRVNRLLTSRKPRTSMKYERK